MQYIQSPIATSPVTDVALEAASRFQRRHWLWALLVVVLATSIGVVVAPVQLRQQWSADTVESLPHIGLYDIEHDERGPSRRWTDGNAAIELPVEHGDGLLTLALHQPFAELSPTVHLTLDDQLAVGLASSAAPRQTHLLLPPALTSDGVVTLGLRNAAIQPPTEGRLLGLILERLTLSRIAAPIWLFGAQSLTIGLATLALAALLRRMGLGLPVVALALVLLCVALFGVGHGAASIATRWRVVGYTLAGGAVLSAGALLPTRSNRLDRAGLTVALAAGTFTLAMFWTMLSRPLWVDEQWRAYHASFGPDWWAELQASVDGPMAAGWLAVEIALTRLLGNTELVLRLPMALSLVGLLAVLYSLARCWLSPLAALLTALSFSFTTSVINYTLEMKAYTWEAMFTVLAVVLWLRYEAQPLTLNRGRWLAAFGIALCCICSLPTIFVAGPLGLLSVWRRGRPLGLRSLGAWLRPLVPLLIGGGLALAHLALFILPQSRLSSSSYWEANFLPGFAPATLWPFLATQTASYFPEAIAGARIGWLTPLQGQLLTALMTIALLFGLVAAFFDRAARALLVAVAGALCLQLIASSLRLWPFGNVRVNEFLDPLLWLLGALGIAWPLHLLRQPGRDAGRRPGRGVPQSGLALSLVCVGLALGAGLTWYTAQQTIQTYRMRDGVRYGDGMRSLVFDARRATTTDDIAVVIHPQAWKGWEYYMRFYDGYPGFIVRRPSVARSRSFFANDARLIDPAQIDGAAPNMWFMALQGSDGSAFVPMFTRLEQRGFCIRQSRNIEFTGVMWRVSRCQSAQ